MKTNREAPVTEYRSEEWANAVAHYHGASRDMEPYVGALVKLLSWGKEREAWKINGISSRIRGHFRGQGAERGVNSGVKSVLDVCFGVDLGLRRCRH